MIRLSIALILGFCGLIFATHNSCAQALPRPDHIVIVIEENKSYLQIIGNPSAPYLNALAQQGTLFTNSYGVTHPSQPNYLALFSGSTHNITNDACLLSLSGDNLAQSLISHGLSFASYSETMPEASYLGCIYGAYMRKHNPLSNWLELAKFNLPFRAIPRDFSALPTVSMVVPDQNNDMHDGSVGQGDTWLRQNIADYAKWAQSHNSLLIVTWDEDDGSGNNRIATIFVGEMVKKGSSAQHINHYSVLRTILEMYDLPLFGHSMDEKQINDVWNFSRISP